MLTWFDLRRLHTKHSSTGILFFFPGHVQLLLGDPEASPCWLKYVNPFSTFWVRLRVSFPSDVPGLPPQFGVQLPACNVEWFSGMLLDVTPNMNRKTIKMRPCSGVQLWWGVTVTDCNKAPFSGKLYDDSSQVCSVTLKIQPSHNGHLEKWVTPVLITF